MRSSHAVRVVVVVVVVGLGLGGGLGCRAARPPASPTMSYEAHQAEAARLEAEATRHDEAAEVARQRGATYECDTHPASEQTTSGTERLQGTRVCDDVAAKDERRHTRAAKDLRREVARHRGLARVLLDGERQACAGFGVEALRDTPLGRGRAAAQVEPLDGGVRVTLPAAELEAVRRELGCHRARAALYDRDAYMPHDPALVPGTRVSVDAAGAGVVVTIHGDAAGAVELVRQRAAALAVPPAPAP